MNDSGDLTVAEVTDRFAAAWHAHHAYLVNLAFRMLNDIGHAEDLVQEAYARLARADLNTIEDDRAWLTVVTSRLCLDHLRSAAARREHARDTTVLEPTTALGSLPPADPADRVTLDDEVRTALSVVLHQLGPAERVAFILHDVFGTPFAEIAETLGRPIASCRQLARRARQKIADSRKHGGPVTYDKHDVVTEKFITACANGDLEALTAVLSPEVWGVAEFGADAPLPPQVNHGRELVAANMVRFNGPDATMVSLPGASQPTLLAFRQRRPYAVITLTVVGQRVAKVHLVGRLDG
ncbi:RNA polymerase sigma factor SigI [Fodinicola acaciae]|uniref:RNA polymerase sigma factor SigI n=1 Tax=Fodinicola acaciae TaxID=2681555 RepID=UPI0013D00C31|nr:RNA polymerase sigma factor SigI [Fodinicola acaciae]